MKYWYLNIKIASVLKSTIYVALALILMTSFFTKWWWGIIVSVIIHIAFVLLRMGKISVVEDRGVRLIHIQDILRKEALSLPITYKSWWTYELSQQNFLFAGENMNGMQHQAGENTIIVLLKMEDSKGEILYLKESIVYDGRFPNEQKYSLEEPAKTASVVEVQRVDQIIYYFKESLGEKNFIKQNQPLMSTSTSTNNACIG